MEEFKELWALVSVDARLFDLSRVVSLVRTAGCYRFPFAVPAVSRTSSNLLVEGPKHHFPIMPDTAHNRAQV